MTQHIHHIPASVEPDEEIMVVVGGGGGDCLSKGRRDSSIWPQKGHQIDTRV